MSIYIITGKTGHGKTAFMTNWIRGSLKAGRRVYSNIKINVDNLGLKKKIEEGFINKLKDRESSKQLLYWSNFSDWRYMTDGIAFVDEGLVYFNARNWEKLPTNLQMKFVQHRKDKVDLVFNVQHYTFIEKTLRMLCERFINIELKLGSSKYDNSKIPRIARVTELDLPTLNRCENLGIDVYNADKEDIKKYHLDTLWREWFWIRKKIFSWYDTGFQVMESRPEPFIHMIRKCEELNCNFQKVFHS